MHGSVDGPIFVERHSLSLNGPLNGPRRGYLRLTVLNLCSLWSPMADRGFGNGQANETKPFFFFYNYNFQ